MLKHFWKYLTSPEYRYWIDFCAAEENLNKSMNLIIDNLKMRNYPMYHIGVDYGYTKESNKSATPSTKV